MFGSRFHLATGRFAVVCIVVGLCASGGSAAGALGVRGASGGYQQTPSSTIVGSQGVDAERSA